MRTARSANGSARVLVAAVAALAAIVAVVAVGAGGGEAAARKALASYLQALRHGDAPKACSQLTTESRAELGQVGAQLLLTGRDSCPAAIEQLLRSGAGPRLRHLAVVPVRRVERDGDVLRAYLAGRSAPMVVRREDGRWRVVGDDVAAAGMFSS